MKHLINYKVITTLEGIELEEKYCLGFLSRNTLIKNRDDIIVELLDNALQQEPELKEKIVKKLSEGGENEKKRGLVQ